MGQETFDTTGNENQDTIFDKIQTMFTELYLGTDAVAGSTGTFTGVVTAGDGLIVDDTATKTATATGGAATLSTHAGKITTAALTTAAAASYTLTLTNTQIAAADQVFVSVAFGTNSAGEPVVTTVTPASGSVVIVLTNRHSANALNGTLVVSFLVVKD